MKTKGLIFVFVLLATVGYSQKKKGNVCVMPDSKSEWYEVQHKVYQKAMAIGDIEVAKKAIYEMLVLKPEKKEWNDSLAYIYFQIKQYTGAVKVCEQILEYAPEKHDILLLKASSLKNLGDFKNALKGFEKYAEKSKTLEVQYEIATIQYQLKRFGELELTISEMVSDSTISKSEVIITVEAGSQKVNMLAAVVNMKGVLMKELGKKEEALKLFKKALEIQSDFYLANQNYIYVSQEIKKSQEQTEGQ